MAKHGKSEQRGAATISWALIVVMTLTAIAALAAAFFVIRSHKPSFAFVVLSAGLAFACCEYALWDVVSVRKWRIGRCSALLTVVVLVVASGVLGTFCELFTLAGSRLLSPFSIGDWHFRRIAVFSFAILCSCCAFLWFYVGAEKKVTVFREIRGLFRETKCWEWVVAVVVIVAALVLAMAFQHFAGLSFEAMVWFLVGIAIVLDVMLLTRHILGEHPEYVVAAIVIGLGCALIFIPPSETGLSYDDQIHYARSVGLSYLTDAEFTVAEEQLRFPPAETTTDVDRPKIESHELVFTQEDFDVYDAALDRVNASEEVLLTSDRFDSISYSYLGHIPAAIGLWLARGFGLSLSLQVLVGKLFGLLFYAWCCFMAVRVSPVRKNVIAVVMLVPGMLFLAANYSYDTWAMGLLAIACAYVLRELNSDEAMTRRTAALLFFVFILGMGPKAIYFPLVGLLLLIPKERFDSRVNRKWFIIGACVLATFVALSFVAPFLAASGQGATDTRGGLDVNAPEQLRFVVNEPLSAIWVLVAYMMTAFLPVLVPFSTASFAYFGELASGWHYAIIAFLAFVAFTDIDKRKKPYMRPVGVLWTFVIVVCVTLLMELALYVSFTPVRNPLVSGMQGRYFFPIIIPLLCFCIPKCIRLPLSKNVYSGIVLTCCMGLICYAECLLVLSRVIA